VSGIWVCVSNSDDMGKCGGESSSSATEANAVVGSVIGCSCRSSVEENFSVLCG